MLAAQMFRAPVESFAGGRFGSEVSSENAWPKARCADLRKFLVQTLQRHIEKKFVTSRMLEKISN